MFYMVYLMALYRIRIACLVMVSLLFLTIHPILADELNHVPHTGWNETETSGGVTNYSRHIEGSDLTAYKGVCVIDCPLEILYSILSNIPEHSKWVKYCATSREINRSSESNSLQYYDFDIPWPLSNRDIVVHCTTDADWEAGKIIIQGEAIKEPLVPIKKDHLRITDSKQEWILEQISPDSTQVTFISYTTIDGPVPSILNALISRVIPSASLKNLKKLSAEKQRTANNRFFAKILP